MAANTPSWACHPVQGTRAEWRDPQGLCLQQSRAVLLPPGALPCLVGSTDFVHPCSQHLCPARCGKPRDCRQLSPAPALPERAWANCPGQACLGSAAGCKLQQLADKLHCQERPHEDQRQPHLQQTSSWACHTLYNARGKRSHPQGLCLDLSCAAASGRPVRLSHSSAPLHACIQLGCLVQLWQANGLLPETVPGSLDIYACGLTTCPSRVARG